MIIDFFLNIVIYLYKAIYFILPKWYFPPGISDAVIFVLDEAKTLVEYLPFVGGIFVAILIIISFEVNYFIAKKIISFINWIRGAGGIEI